MPDASTQRLEVLKTYKLLIDGKFPRTESGRSMPVYDAKGRAIAHACLASRKDVRDAVEAARKAQPGWASATAYLRGQILYRMSEMLEGKKGEFVELLDAITTAKVARAAARPRSVREREVTTAIDRLVAYAGWADKYAQLLGCNNPVSGPYYNFTTPEATGVVGVLAPDELPLLGLVSLIAPALCAGNCVVALASSRCPLAGAVFGEVCATGDVPAGAVNVLTGDRAELLVHFATHREIDAVHAAGLSLDQARSLQEGGADNVKRLAVRNLGHADWFDARACENPWWIEPFVEMKTVWHPAGA